MGIAVGKGYPVEKFTSYTQTPRCELLDVIRDKNNTNKGLI
jgi:hypothetical protein